MARLSNVTREQLKPEDQAFFDSIADSRGGVRGPYGVLLHSPDLAARIAHTGAYVRYNLDLPLQKTLEITALIGHYLLVGQILAAFEVELPAGAKAELPE